MKIHLLGFPHTETTDEYSWCAYTQKTRKLANMLHDMGWDVRLYGGEQSQASATEHIQVVKRFEQKQWFGHYKWDRDVFNNFDAQSDGWLNMNTRSIVAIRERAEPGDILGLTMGLTHKPVADVLGHLIPVEVGIGYSGVFAPYRVYESYAWMHHLAGVSRQDDMPSYDTVIPNAIEPEDFPLGAGDGGFDLFIGRFIRRKGPQLAAAATAKLGQNLVMAGQGVLRSQRGRYEGIENFVVEGDHITHVGVLGPEKRAALMGAARAVWVPTIYLEPFGGVAVEAMACGTPVITSDWGAFTETVQQGVTGFRCRTLEEFIEGGRQAGDLDREAIRKYAVGRYGVDTVKHQYDTYLRKFQDLTN